MSDITIAASAKAFTELFNEARDNFHFAKSDSGSFGPFTASYAVAMHLQGGSLALNDDDTIEVTDLEIVWDTLTVQICFTLPGWCVGGFCVVPDPWNGCLVNFPGFCIGGESICAPLDLSGLVSEISDLKARLIVNYYIDPARQPGWSDLDAEFNGHPNKWQLFIDPVLVNVDPIDIPASVANLLENAVKDAITNLIPSWVPGWAVDLLWAIIGPILDFVTSLLGIVGSIEDWLSDLLGNTFGLLTIIETAIADYFASQYPIKLFEDPFPILQAESGLIPVKIPIRNLTATVNSKEMIVTADIGA
jgi:hypothetical protein